MLVVLVVNLKVCVPLLAPPVGHDMEGAGVGAGQWSDLIFQNVNIEVGSLEIEDDTCKKLLTFKLLPEDSFWTV